MCQQLYFPAFDPRKEVRACGDPLITFSLRRNKRLLSRKNQITPTHLFTHSCWGAAKYNSSKYNPIHLTLYHFTSKICAEVMLYDYKPKTLPLLTNMVAMGQGVVKCYKIRHGKFLGFTMDKWSRPTNVMQLTRPTVIA